MNKSSQSLVEKITIVETEAHLSALLTSLYEQAKTRAVRIAFVNAHGFNMAWVNPAFAADLMACDCVFRDGSGMKILYQLLGRSAGLNLNGTDLIPKILKDFTGQTIALFGTAQPYLDNSARVIEEMGGKVVSKIDGFQGADIYVGAAHAAPAALTVLAMGMPKQEAVARALAMDAQSSGLIICGGAILDFMGDKVTRAPDIFRKMGMEWVYRLMLEPKRLFGRYVVGNGIFLIRAILTMIADKGGQGIKKTL